MPSQLRSPNRVLLLALLLGIGADYLFNGRWVGVSAPMFVAAGLLALGWLSVSEGRAPTRANRWLGGAALLFAGLIAVRDEPLLVVLDGVAVAGLLLLYVANYRGASVARLSVLQSAENLFKASWNIGISPAPLAAQTWRSVSIQRVQFRAALPVVRGFALAVPALLVFGGLLMAADSVFASYVVDTLTIRLPFNVASSINHAVVALLIAWLCAGGMAVALNAPAAAAAASPLPAEGDTQRLVAPEPAWRMLGWVEALTMLVLIDVLFGSFMLIQGAYFFGGLDTLARTNMTYADYARRGFFELLVVACLALLLLWTLALVTRRGKPREFSIFNAASGVMVVLVIGMLVSAFQRMWLYEEAYSFTRLRIYTHSFMIWLAVVLVLFLVALLRDQLKLFVFGSFVSALVYLALLNIASPDALIVRANIARYHAGGDLDADYLASLSADATPALNAAIGDVDDTSRVIIRNRMQQQHAVISAALAEQGWPAWSVARARVLAAAGQ
jgi:hypothetical protein